MGFIKKWGKIIIVVIVFGGILSLVARIPGAGSAGGLTSEPMEFSTVVSTMISTPTPTAISTPMPVSQTQEALTMLPEETQELPTMPPEETQELPSVPQEEPLEPSTISPEKETQDMTQEVQENTCALGHDFHTSVWETATCLKGGYYNNVCRRCGLVESVSEDPLPHDVEDILVQEGNCMQDTVIRHVCKSCGQQVESDTRYTPEVHKWIYAVVDGKEVFYCEWCGVVQ